MLTLEQISPKNASLYRAIRLQALQDSPLAFGSTYAKESQLSENDWLNRAADWGSDRSIGYLGVYQGIPCGIIASYLDEDDLLKAHLVSMWVNPGHRRSGIGRGLVESIQAWAKNRGARMLLLTVTNINHAAIEFYKRNGFVMTGNTEAYPNDPALFEYEMAHPIGA